ncbi:hypothetical protein [Desulfonema magnum]|uniref:Uncharacterized protein n=1 Tax=Desulfonema magnum TaxID=45655 RepID=A0A975GLL0_9BACT|nr:hypothetical protein [Desulfonema magnum]QTA85695.1 Uncharacterized protein dnm_017090 [Desulfonema magnum]
MKVRRLPTHKPDRHHFEVSRQCQYKNRFVIRGGSLIPQKYSSMRMPNTPPTNKKIFIITAEQLIAQPRKANRHMHIPPDKIAGRATLIKKIARPNPT